MNAKLQNTLAMVIFGSLSIFVRAVPLSSAEVAFFRAVIAMVVILLVRLIKGEKIQFAALRKMLPRLFLSGALMGFNWILLFEAYRYTTVSVATLSYYFAPSLVVIASVFLFREKLSARQLVCFLLTTAGLVLIMDLSGGAGGDQALLGIALGLGAAALYASVVLLNRTISGITGLDRTLCQLAAAAIVVLPYILLTSGFHLSLLTPLSGASLLVIGIVHTGLAYVLYFSSIAALKGRETAILGYIDPLVAVLVSISVFHESMTVLQAIGGAMVLGFTLLSEVGIRKKSAEKS